MLGVPFLHKIIRCRIKQFGCLQFCLQIKILPGTIANPVITCIYMLHFYY